MRRGHLWRCANGMLLIDSLSQKGVVVEVDQAPAEVWSYGPPAGLVRAGERTAFFQMATGCMAIWVRGG